MKKFLVLIAVMTGLYTSNQAQDLQQLDTVRPLAEYENIYLRTLYHDSLASSFIIYIKKEVKPHKHLTHAEHVLILEGTGEMKLGSNTVQVKKGSIIYIPPGTIHSLRVTSKKPVKALSIQAPYFDGKDRVIVPE